MSLAGEMKNLSTAAVNTDEYMMKLWEKTKEIIRKAAMEGKNYVCYYDCCHPCDRGYTKDNDNKLKTKLRDNGFAIKEKYKLFGGDQVTPYIVW